MIHRILIAFALRLVGEPLTQGEQFERPIDDLVQAFQIDRLDDEVVGAQLHRFYGVLHRAIGGQHDHE